MLEVSVEFVTAEQVEVLILQQDLSDAWEISNLFLRSIGSGPISSKAPNIVGFSTEAKSFVSTSYFIDAHPLDDYVVHELAHVFHNVKRRTAGLRKSLRCEWLLPNQFQKRETFAYACEVYSRILALRKKRKDRLALFEELKNSFTPADERVFIVTNSGPEPQTDSILKKNFKNALSIPFFWEASIQSSVYQVLRPMRAHR